MICNEASRRSVLPSFVRKNKTLHFTAQNDAVLLLNESVKQNLIYVCVKEEMRSGLQEQDCDIWFCLIASGAVGHFDERWDAVREFWESCCGQSWKQATRMRKGMTESKREGEGEKKERERHPANIRRAASQRTGN